MKQWLTTLVWHEPLLLLITLLISFPFCCTQNTYYITPATDAPCPAGEPLPTSSPNMGNSTSRISVQHNTGVSFWRACPQLYHLFGTVDHYPPDYYHLHISLTLVGIPSPSSSSSLPEVSSTIRCTWPAGFVFSDFSELHINALGFISCGHYGSAAINIQSVRNVSISNCAFQNNTNIQSGLSNSGFGGALRVCSSTLTLVRNNFRQNFAQFGGAIQVGSHNTLTLSGNILQDNSADFGGALFAERSNAITLSDNTFLNNSANNNGGALGANMDNTLKLSRNIFVNNSAECGGTLHAESNNNLAISENTFLNNTGNYGSALFADTSNTLTLSENRFWNNSANSAIGGAICAYVNNTLTLSDCTFHGNSATTTGGALYANVGNTFSISDSTFLINSANYGGAIFAYENNTFTLSNNTFQNNSAATCGAALDAGRGNTLSILDNKFLTNSVDYGGAVCAYANNILTSLRTYFRATQQVLEVLFPQTQTTPLQSQITHF